MKHALALAAASLALAACADPTAPTLARKGPAQPNFTVTAQDIFQRYVALGTSNSMGVQSAGIFASGQRAAWPAQLAARVGLPFSLPLVQDPGCGPPLLPPLAADAALVGAFGNDLVTAVMNTCAPLQTGVTLPANSVAISGANVHDALYSTLETEGTTTRTGILYSRVLPPGATQVAAMVAQRPTFVSVELAASVSLNCYFSSNYIFVPGYVLTLLSKTPTTATCADVPGAADYILTASDMNAINQRMSQMNAHMQAKAIQNGYAYFSLDAVYALPKPRFSVSNLLFSNAPFGTYISLDGVHPSTQGQTLLAMAAAQAINAAYAVAIPLQ